MTKAELCARAGTILRSGKITPEDDAFVRELIKRHPDASHKIGCGIERLEIRPNPVYPGDTFWLIRRDGTESDFSFRQCVNDALSHRTKVLTAMRCYVVPQILDFMRHNLTPDARCAITGAPLTDENVHVDHDPPFIEIARAFLKKIGGVEAINLRSASAGAFVQRFVNIDFEIRWKDFHRAHVTLFLTTAKANMRKGARNLSSSVELREAEVEQPHAQDRATENECSAT